jgi:hypothetical protein
MSDEKRQQDMTPDELARDLKRRAGEADVPRAADPPMLFQPGSWRGKDTAEETGAAWSPKRQQEQDRLNFAAEGWRRTWKAELERLPRPQPPGGLAGVSEAIDGRLADLFAPVLEGWRQGQPYRELRRVRGQVAQVEAEKAKADGALARAQEAYQQAARGEDAVSRPASPSARRRPPWTPRRRFTPT